MTPIVKTFAANPSLRNGWAREKGCPRRGGVSESQFAARFT